MLYKIKNKPVGYQIWAVSVAIGVIYFAVKLFLFEATSFDRLIEVYVWFSFLLDYFFFPKKEQHN